MSSRATKDSIRRLDIGMINDVLGTYPSYRLIVGLSLVPLDVVNSSSYKFDQLATYQMWSAAHMHLVRFWTHFNTGKHLVLLR